MENNNIQLEAIVCKCGAKYAASLFPFATDWLKSKLRAKKKGHSIEIFDVTGFKFSKCECHKLAKKEAITNLHNIQLEAIVCKCGAKYAASLFPFATDWLKSKLRAKKKGHPIDIFDVTDFKFSKCECRKLAKKEAITNLHGTIFQYNPNSAF